MRWFALGLLVVINLVLLLWQLLVQQPQQPRPAVLPDIGELRLVSELELPTAQDAAVPDESDPEMIEGPVIAASESDERVDSTASEADGAADSAVVASLAGHSNASPGVSDTVPLEIDAEPGKEPEKATAQQLNVAPREAAGEDSAEMVAAEALAEEARLAHDLAGVLQEGPVPGEPPEPEALPEISPEPRQACWRLGPFDSEEEANELAQRLPEEWQQLRLETVRVKVPNGYYVLIPPLADRDAALAVERSLKESGIQDSWVFVSGPLKNAVSLGLFNREINARRRLQRVEARGFQPEMRPRFRQEQQIGLLLSGPEDAQGEDVLVQLGAGDPEPVPCP